MKSTDCITLCMTEEVAEDFVQMLNDHYKGTSEYMLCIDLSKKSTDYIICYPSSKEEIDE